MIDKLVADWNNEVLSDIHADALYHIEKRRPTEKMFRQFSHLSSQALEKTQINLWLAFYGLLPVDVNIHDDLMNSNKKYKERVEKYIRDNYKEAISKLSQGTKWLKSIHSEKHSIREKLDLECELIDNNLPAFRESQINGQLDKMISSEIFSKVIEKLMDFGITDRYIHTSDEVFSASYDPRKNKIVALKDYPFYEGNNFWDEPTVLNMIRPEVQKDVMEFLERIGYDLENKP